MAFNSLFSKFCPISLSHFHAVAYYFACTQIFISGHLKEYRLQMCIVYLAILCQKIFFNISILDRTDEVLKSVNFVNVNHLCTPWPADCLLSQVFRFPDDNRKRETCPSWLRSQFLYSRPVPRISRRWCWPTVSFVAFTARIAKVRTVHAEQQFAMTDNADVGNKRKIHLAALIYCPTTVAGVGYNANLDPIFFSSFLLFCLTMQNYSLFFKDLCYLN